MRPNRLLASLAAILLHTVLTAAPTGIEQADWRGSDEVLLTAGTRTFTERDALLFALVGGGIDPAELRTWKTQTPERREAIRDLLLMRLRTDWLAEQRQSLPAGSERLDMLAARINAAPVARWIWADTIVRQSVTIFPEDLIQAYRVRTEEFVNPGFVSVRRLRVPFPTSLTIESQNEARREVERLRTEAERQGGLAPLLRDRPDLLLDPPGSTVELKRNARDVDAQLLEAAFALSIGQISQPIRTTGGFLLIEVIDRTDPEPVALETVRPNLEESLRRRFIPQQFDYLLARRTADAYPSNNAALYQFMPPETDLVRVRNFAITKEEFSLLYFDRLLEGRASHRLFISERAGSIVANEVVTEELEKAELIFDDFYASGLKLGAEVHAAREYVRLTQSQISPTDEEAAAYLDENVEALTPGVSRTLWRLDVFLRNPANMSQGERDAMQILMRTYAESLIADALRQLDERRQLASQRGILEPNKVVENLPQPDDLRVRTRFVKVGQVTRQDALQTTGVPFDRLTLGDFTPAVTLEGNTVSSYFVSEENATPTPPREVLLESARRALIDARSVEGASAHIEGLRASNQLIFHEALVQ
jgi:hypothetical protein